jgi:hypothetical protein
VWVGEYRGLREVRHSGSTAGYRAYLTTFPGARAGVAVLCNAANANADGIAYKVADRVLAPQLKPATERRSTHLLTDAEAAALAGLYRDIATGVPSRLVREGERLRLERGAVLYADSGSRLRGTNGQQWVFAEGGRVTITDAFGRVNTLERVAPWTPEAADLAALAGEYASSDAEAAFTAVVVDGRLVLRQRPDRVVALTPLYEGAFSSTLGTVRFVRDATGRATAFTVSQDRVWSLRFAAVRKED